MTESADVAATHDRNKVDEGARADCSLKAAEPHQSHDGAAARSESLASGSAAGLAVTVIHADCRAALREFASDSVDACVTDPPYALVAIGKRFGAENAAPCKEGKTGAYARASRGFMGKTWDTGEAAFDPATWSEVLRVLKPGGHLIAFGGTRTYHRLACAIEDAGFEIRDMIAWLYGSGFPKSHNVGKTLPEWDGWGTALKPALEPIVLARKPLIGTVAANVLKHGTGALNIDASRIETAENLNGGTYSGSRRLRDCYTPTDSAPGAVPLNRLANGAGEFVQPSGRWPANVIHDGSDEVVTAFPASDSGSGSGSGGIWSASTGKPAGPTYGDGNASAARFFYSAKADAEDRLESKHPTVKPVDLIAYLTRLVTPPGGTVLDPFAGSGTLGMACMREGFNAILIEREAEYVADIKRRIAHVHGNDTPLFAGAA